jgi:hypothetical protein
VQCVYRAAAWNQIISPTLLIFVQLQPSNSRLQAGTNNWHRTAICKQTSWSCCAQSMTHYQALERTSLPSCFAVVHTKYIQNISWIHAAKKMKWKPLLQAPVGTTRKIQWARQPEHSSSIPTDVIEAACYGRDIYQPPSPQWAPLFEFKWVLITI